MRKVAYFITPHGFGHASRASAIMEAWRRSETELRFELFTTVPKWFFDDSLGGGFDYHPIEVDVGMVQKDALQVDMEETLRRLASLYPLRSDLVAQLAAQVAGLGCSLVLADIAPLGIAVARHAGIPSVLVENFTWDQIYGGYLAQEPRLGVFIENLRGLAEQATVHIQTEPVCVPAARAVRAAPVSRRLREDPSALRRRLAILPDTPVVLITMGGNSMSFDFLEKLHQAKGTTFLVSGQLETLTRRENVIIFPPRSGLHHPDLVAMSALVVGKLGYSTVAEVFQAQTPFLYISRPNFLESEVLQKFVQERLPAAQLSEEEFRSGAWIPRIEEYAALKRARPCTGRTSGAGEVVEALRRLSPG
jgi:hypothetical protein